MATHKKRNGFSYLVTGHPTRSLSVFTLVFVVASASAFAGPPDFSRDVLPVLASKCFPCHGPDGEKRKAGLRLDLEDALGAILPSGARAVVRDDPAQSAMLYRITSDDPAERMPPEAFPKPLTEPEIETLRRWIEAGAPWEAHWAFEPLDKTAPPAVNETGWPRNPIDSFILAAQETRGLSHAPEAGKRTLIRRLTYDLTGLPPTPEEVDAFLADTAPDAYERLADRLLASPRYGERWARHWLDVAHYGETHGYDKDKRRPNAWPYRDYVINALNRDLPYGRFVEDQVAGDVLHPDSPDSTVATGFLAAGPWDFVGHVELREGTLDKRITRNLDRDDMTANVMNTFTSLTVQCARCHDHKFDPIAQADYYSLQAVFAGVDRADRPYDTDPGVHQTRQRLRAELAGIQHRLDALRTVLNAVEDPELESIAARREETRNQLKQIDGADSPSNGYHSGIEAKQDVTKWVQVDLGQVVPVDSLRLVPARPTDFADTPGFGFPLRFKIELSADGDFASPTILVDFTTEDHHIRTDAPYDVDGKGTPARIIRVTATRLWKRTGDYVFALAELEVVSGGENIARKGTVTALDNIDSGRWNTKHLIDGYDSRRRLDNDSPGSDDDTRKALEAQLQELDQQERQVRVAALPEAERGELEQLEARSQAVEEDLAALPEPNYVYAATADYKGTGNFNPPGEMRVIHVLNRGDVDQPGAEAVPGTVGCIPALPARFDLPANHTEGDRRAALAQWLTAERNPLTWRSIVNRVWQYHFGHGIVDTPNDFGRMGTPPTHPELLDWLAASFLEHGQSLKWLHRLIVTSATYRQASTHDTANAVIDDSNRYLWRMNRRQLEAEAFRDSVLALSGKLDLTMGGPGVDLFRFVDDHSPRYLYEEHDPRDETAYRRSIYRFIVRSVPDPLMTTLDCADPSQSVPVRTETVTALQALTALNNPMIVRQADYFAERLKSMADATPDQIIAGFRLALCREPSEDERALLTAYAEEHGLPAACRLIYNTNEFMYVD